MTRTSAALALLVMTLAIPATAETRQAAVSYSNAELTTEAGAQQVLERIRVSAKRACEATSRLLLREQYRCERELAGNLVARIDHKALLAIYRADQAPNRVAMAN